VLQNRITQIIIPDLTGFQVKYLLYYIPGWCSFYPDHKGLQELI